MYLKPVTIVSLFAATLSMVSYVPQAWEIIRSRNTDGISLRMYVVTVAGFVAWLAYGLLLGQWAIIVQNVICLCLSAFILTMKLLPRATTAAVAAKLDPTGPASSIGFHLMPSRLDIDRWKTRLGSAQTRQRPGAFGNRFIRTIGFSRPRLERVQGRALAFYRSASSNGLSGQCQRRLPVAQLGRSPAAVLELEAAAADPHREG